MKYLLQIACLFLLGLLPVCAQTAVKDSSKVYTYVEKMPELVSGGGIAGIASTLARRTMMPLRCDAYTPSLQTVVSFTISPNGVAYGGRIEKPSIDFRFDSSALKAVRSLPKMKPGYQNGKPVAVRLSVPIRVFRQ